MRSNVSSPPDCSVPVGPADCALAVGVPLDRADFLERSSRPETWDFAAKETARYGVTSEFAWEQFAPEANAMQRYCRQVKLMGCVVRRSATLADFASLFGHFKVITLLTHWPLLSLPPSDIPDPSAIAKTFHAPSHPIHQALRRALTSLSGISEQATMDWQAGDIKGFVRHLGAVVDDANRSYIPPPPPPRLTVLERMLRWILPAHSPLPASGSTRWEASAGSLPLTRAALERAFPDAILPGRTIEFRDGMCTTPDFLAAIPPDFSGVLHLAACHSVLVGQAVKDRCVRCLAVMNRYPTALLFRLMEYILVIECLSSKRVPYREAMERIRVGFLSFF